MEEVKRVNPKVKGGVNPQVKAPLGLAPPRDTPRNRGFSFLWKLCGNFHHFQETRPVKGESINPCKSGGSRAKKRGGGRVSI